MAYNAGRIEVAETGPRRQLPARHAGALSRSSSWPTLKQKLGEGRLEKIDGIHALSGRFTLACEKGRLTGTVLLSPEPGAGIQKLTLTVEE